MSDVLRMALDRIEALEKRCSALITASDASNKAIGDLTGLVKAQTANAERMTGIIAELQATVIAQTEVISRNAESAAQMCTTIGQTVDAHWSEHLKMIEQNAANCEDLVGQMENHRIETATLVSRLRDPLPKQLMIDQIGMLVAIDHSGDTREIGRVVGEAGRDAPRIEAATWKAGHVVISMSDRTSHLIELPAPAPVAAIEPAPALPGRTPEGDGIKAAVRMGIIMEAATAGKSVKSVAAIAKRYSLPPVTVRAIIRDHENEAKMRGTGSTH